MIFIVFSLTELSYLTESISAGERRKPIPYSMAIEKVKLVQEYFLKRLRMGTARTKVDKEREEKSNQKRVKMERSKLGTK